MARTITILPLIVRLLREAPFLPSERDLLKQQSYNLSPKERAGWLMFLNENPDFFTEVAYRLRDLETQIHIAGKEPLEKLVAEYEAAVKELKL